MDIMKTTFRGNERRGLASGERGERVQFPDSLVYKAVG